MALCRSLNLHHACQSVRGYVLLKAPQPIHLFSKQSRAFKRVKWQETKHEFDPSTPFGQTPVDVGKLSLGSLWKPLGFTLGFTGACYAGAVIWQYENMRHNALRIFRRPGFMQKQGTLRRDFNKWWNSLSSGEKIFVPICALNVLVFAAWRVPRLQPTMLRYFCSNPGSTNVCLPMLLSTFSHYSLFHLLANMYVLHSFSTGAVASLGKEQFLGLYLSAGVISSFTSYVFKTVTRQPGLSLGASGAIMAILGYVCTQYPDTRLGIILLPFLTFSASSAIKVIVGLDVAGVMMGWKLFDHAAHLGGAFTGIAWAYWGQEHVWQKRDPLLQYWHDLRGAIK